MWTLSLPYPNLSSFDLASIDRRSDLYVWLLLNTFLTKVYSSVSISELYKGFTCILLQQLDTWIKSKQNWFKGDMIEFP